MIKVYIISCYDGQLSISLYHLPKKSKIMCYGIILNSCIFPFPKTTFS